MKYNGQISTGQYEFIAWECEGSAEDAVLAHKELLQAYSSEGSGLPSKEWNAWLDNYLQGKAGSVDEWEQMSTVQKNLINEIKKSINRRKEK